MGAEELAASADGAAAGAAKSSAPKLPATVQQLKDPLHIATEHGFTLGVIVHPNSKGHSCYGPKWRIAEFVPAGVRMEQVTIEDDAPRYEASFQELITYWKLAKGKDQAILPGWSWNEHRASPLQCKAWATDLAKSICSLGLRAHYVELEDTCKGLQIFSYPVVIRVTENYKAGQLQLPAASQKLDFKQVKGSFLLGCFDLQGYKEGIQIYMSSQIVMPVGKQGTEAKAPWVCPFWLVGKDPSKFPDEKGNLSLHWIDTKVEEHIVHIPFLRNTCNLQKGDTLCWLRQDEMVFVKKGKDGPPAKRQRR